MIIFVSDNQVQAEDLCTHLKQNGYLYSVVPDDAKALDAIRTDRASLLLIDTGCTSFNGFTLCKKLKADEAHKDLPVILVTGLSDVSVLLSVLDSRADAFIPQPADPDTLLSTINDLVRVQEGEKPPSAVRTRFVVSHEGCDYSVFADRRQLLEFLLYTFELAGRIRSEQEQMQGELQAAIKELSERLVAVTGERDATVKNLHEEVEERARTISKLNATIQAKDQQEILLRTQSDKFLQDLSEKGSALESTRSMLEEKSQAVTALEGKVAALSEDRERLQEQIQQQKDDLIADIERLNREISSTSTALAQEQLAGTGLEERLASLTKTLSQADEKIRTTTVDLEAARDSWKPEHQKVEALEGQIQVLNREKDATERSSQERLGEVSRNFSEIQAALIQAQERLSDEIAANRILKEQIAELTEERDKVARSHEAVSTSHSKVQEELEAQSRALEEEQRLRATAGSELEDLRRKYENVQQFLDSASRDIGLLTATLSEEKEKRKNTEERLNAALRESENKDRSIQILTEERAALAGEPGGQKNPSGRIIQLPPVPSQEQQQADDVSQSPRDNLPRPPREALGKKEQEPLLPSPTVQLQISEPAPSLLLSETAAPETVGTAAEPEKPLPVPENPVPETGGAATTPSLASTRQPADWAVNRNLWFDMIKWVHHTTSVPEEQRKSLLSDLMKMSRLVQQGRHLTTRQETDMRSLLARMKALGYRFP
jgi:CheY-like chemotaxis protein